MPQARVRRRVAIGAAGILLALLLLTLAAVALWRHGFARSEPDGRLAAWANRRPDRLKIEWQAVRSPWPGRVELDGLRVAGRSRKLVWEVTAERASGWLSPWALLRREVRWDGVAARGVSVRVAHTGPVPARRRQPVTTAMPRIEDFPQPPVPRPAGGRKRWGFALRHLEFAELREVWIDDRRFTGSARGHGGFAIRNADGRAEVFASNVSFSAGRLLAGGVAVAEGLAGDGRLRIEPWPYRGTPAAAVAARAVGRLDLTGDLDVDALLAYLFGDWPGLELESGPSRVEAHLATRRGSLRPGSSLRLVTPRQEVRFLGFEA
ncbi:MAG TPA: hypothetical protein VMT16_06860, partial [Thermoanaerobaculia bacterium]|nr:hypothetical protein [Thermoanaerobaculia bacterium]